MKKNRKLVPILAAASSLLLAAMLVVGAAAAPDPFIGKWHSTDVDDSYQTLTIGGGPGGTHHFRYRDFGATVCGLDGGGGWLYGASATGVLTASGATLSSAPFTVPVYCLASPPTFFDNVVFTFTLDGDTLVQSEPGDEDVVWYR